MPWFFSMIVYGFSRFLEVDAGEQSRPPAADDDDRKGVVGRLLRGCLEPGDIGPAELELFVQHGTYSGGTGSQANHSIISVEELRRERCRLHIRVVR